MDNEKQGEREEAAATVLIALPSILSITLAG
jgi:hypothetical protein